MTRYFSACFHEGPEIHKTREHGLCLRGVMKKNKKPRQEYDALRDRDRSFQGPGC